MNERKLIREFLDKASTGVYASHDHDHSDNGESHHDIEFEPDGTISAKELHNHFDLDNNGKVTAQEYIDHIEYHAAHPESLDHYRNLRHDAHKSVPCTKSYDSCSSHLMSKPEDIEKYLKPLMVCTGSTCKTSSARAILDVLKSLTECGIM